MIRQLAWMGIFKDSITAYIELPYSIFFKLSNRHKKVNHKNTFTSPLALDFKIPDQFPLVYKVTDSVSIYKNASKFEHFKNNKRFVGFKPLTEEIRKFNNKYYKPLRYCNGAAVSTLFLKPKDFWEYYKNDANYIAEAVSKKSVDDNHSTVLDSYISWKHITLSDNRKEVIKAVKNWFKQFLFFNGKIWVETDPPCYTYNTFGLGCNHGGTAIFIEYTNINKIHGSQKKFYAKPEDREKFIQKVLKVAQDRGDTKYIDSIKNLEDNIEIIHNT